MTEPHLERAHLLMNTKRFADAGMEIQKHLANEPNDADAHTLLAICFLNQNKLDEAEQIISSAITLNPADSFSFFIHSRILFAKENSKLAEEKIREAIHLNPFSAEFFAWLAQIQLSNKDYVDALNSANEGLAIEPENINALNIRAIALVKLNRKDEAYNTIQDALTGDPENSTTHANTGWAMLEKGDHKKSLTHFYEALRIDPNNDWAKHGMVEGLKARYWIYRIFLRYMFWIGNLKSNVQYFVIFGTFILVKILQYVSQSNPSVEPFITPIVIAYGLFAFSTWIMQPVFNLLLFLHPQGRYVLDKEERYASMFVGSSLSVGIISLILFFFTMNETLMLAGIFGITMSLPLATMFRPLKEKNQRLLQIYTAGLALFGVLSIVLAAMGKDYLVTGGIYAAGLFVFQIVANSVIGK